MENRKIILIIGEDPCLRFTLAQILEREGYQVDCVSRCQMTLFHADDSLVDLIIVDDSENWDACCCKLMEIRNLYAKQPILLLTERLPRTASDQSYEICLDEIIQKPFDPTIILENVQKLVSKR